MLDLIITNMPNSIVYTEVLPRLLAHIRFHTFVFTFRQKQLSKLLKKIYLYDKGYVKYRNNVLTMRHIQ